MPTTKKAIYFDLDYNALKHFYSNTSPNNAYAEIENALDEMDDKNIEMDF